MSNTINPLGVSLDQILQTLPFGSQKGAYGNLLRGINHQMQPIPVSNSHDSNGYVFMTRPQLNLSLNNIRGDRRFIPLLTTSSDNVNRVIRLMLDPRLAYTDNSLASEQFDNTQAFFPILTNTISSCTGWPDSVVDTATTKPGLMKESSSWIDGIFEINNTFSLNCTFRNVINDPLMKLFSYWLLYGTKVFSGDMWPYLDMLMHNRIDYNTRIYRIILNKSKTKVTHISSTGASFPETVPNGSLFDFNHEEPTSQNQKDISVQFKCIGAIYNDPITVIEFNKVVGIFQPNMKTNNILQLMQKVPYAALKYFNYKGYPRIDPNTMEFQWWVSKSEYARVIGNINETFSALATI